MNREGGYTLIELLTTVSIIGVLASLAITSLALYRTKAAYAGATVVLHDAHTAVEAALSQQDNLPGAVPMSSTMGPGRISDPAGSRLLPGMQLGNDVKLRYAYDPACTNAGCMESYLQANHCKGQEYTRWIRFGDGLEVTLEHVAGAGCP